MAWTVIPDSDIDPDSPITTGLMTGLRDNFAAMAAGDSGAPIVLGSSVVLLSTQSASASASIDFTSDIDSTYKRYIFVFDGLVPATNIVSFLMRISNNGGSSWISTGYVDLRTYQSLTSALTSTNASGQAQATISSASTKVSNVSGRSMSGNLDLYSPSNVNLYPMWDSFTTYIDENGGLANNRDSGQYTVSTGAIDAVQFYFSTGNITSGSIKLYGIKDS